MRPEMAQAATAAAARTKAHTIVYTSGHTKSNGIDDVLAALILGLAVRHHARSERVFVAGKIDRLLRRKIELGLLKGGRHDG